MKRNLLLFLLIGLCVGLCHSPARGQESVTILATVNGEAITQTDVDEILQPIYQQYTNTYKGDTLTQKLAAARADILTQLIEDKLILQQAQKRREEFPLEAKEIDMQIAELRTNFKTEEEFNAILRQQNITLADLRRRYREQLLVKRLVAHEVLRFVTVSPSEIAEYYAVHKETFREPEEIRLRNIFLAQRNDEEALQTKIHEIFAQAQKGTPFGELIERYSEDQNVVATGDMGVIKKGTLRAEIDSVVFNTAVGMITPPVKTPNGYYIFKIEERQESRIPPLENVQNIIRRRLFDDKMRVRMDEWIEKLKNQAFIEVRTHETKEKS